MLRVLAGGLEQWATLAELGMVLTDPGYSLADRSGHTTMVAQLYAADGGVEPAVDAFARHVQADQEMRSAGCAPCSRSSADPFIVGGTHSGRLSGTPSPTVGHTSS